MWTEGRAPPERSLALDPGEFMRRDDKRFSCKRMLQYRVPRRRQVHASRGLESDRAVTTEGAALGVFLGGSFGLPTEARAGLWSVRSCRSTGCVVLRDDGPLVVCILTDETLWTSMSG